MADGTGYRGLVAKKRHHEERQTFAETVREVKAGPAPLGPMTVIHSVAHAKWFHGPGGVGWHRRGEDILEGKKLVDLLMDPAVEVLHEYMDKRTLIPFDQRKKFWDDAVQTMEQWPHSDFYGVEFENDDHIHMLVIHEDC